jgi:hypothetical protein
MEENKPAYSTISYSPELASELKDLCQKNAMKQKEFLENSIRFFRRTGINPADELLDLRSQTQRSENRLIGLLKTQDKDAQKHFLLLNDRILQLEKTAKEQAEILGKILDALS